MKLYSGPLSLFTAKTRIALAEKQLAYERIDVGWSLDRRYDPHHPEVVAINPKREVPVLVDGDVVVYDSTQIFEYLEDRYPAPPLYPGDVAGRARCRRLEAAADEQLFPHVWPLIEERFYPPRAPGRDPERARRAEAGVLAYLQGLDGELAGRPYLCGDFGVADIGHFIFVGAAASFGAAPPEGLREIGAWMARMIARPSVAAEMAQMTAYRSALAG
jgi:glutathione S-transferase